MKHLILGVFLGIIILGTVPVFAQGDYAILKNKFQNQPLVCIYEPDVPDARQIIKDTWVKETELGVKNWQYELQSLETRNTDKWHIEILKIPVEKQLLFDNKYCDVEIKFDRTAAKTESGSVYAGIHWFDGVKNQIRLVYTDLEVCRTWIEGNYRYTEWCYQDDYVRSKALGNVATHEFGHALGLGHYTSSNPDENREWSSDPYGSPSVMTQAVHYNEDLNKIRRIDVDKVKEIYGSDGFGKSKSVILPEISTIEQKNIGGFESFFVSQPEFIKKRGSVDFVTISGKVTEDAYSRGQNVLIKVVSPDGRDEELKALTLNNRQFSIQIRVDDTIQTGTYTLDARYMGFDSDKLFFTVSEYSSTVTESKKEYSIPPWIRNNAKWWSDGTIGDRDFVMGVQYLAQQDIIKIPHTSATLVEASQEIPSWIRNNAKWWADGMITDSDFVKGVQYLAQKGIISVN